MPFATLFSNVAAKLFGASRVSGADDFERELVQLAVEAVVDAVDPRLRTVSGYKRKIAPGMVRTISYMRALASDLPAPIALSRSSWASDPLTNAMFATADDIGAVLGRCEELHAFFGAPENAAVGNAHVLLGMQKTERSVFAPALVDGAVRHDVAQTTVSFSNHRLGAPAADFTACRREVGARLLRRLAALALGRITMLGEQAADLEQRKAMLGARLRMLNLRRNGVEAVAGDVGDVSGEITAIERELGATVDKYVAAKTSLATLSSRIDQINAVFGSPADYLTLARSELRVNRMGFKVAAGSDEAASDLVLRELSIGDGLTGVIAFVSCQRADLPPRETLSARGAREVL